MIFIQFLLGLFYKEVGVKQNTSPFKKKWRRNLLKIKFYFRSLKNRIFNQ